MAEYCQRLSPAEVMLVQVASAEAESVKQAAEQRKVAQITAIAETHGVKGDWTVKQEKGVWIIQGEKDD